MLGSSLLALVVVALLFRRYWRRGRADDLPGFLASAAAAVVAKVAINARGRARLVDLVARR